jgi:ribonuclease P protein component
LAATPTLGRIVRSADFERVLATPACARSPHFAVHFVDGRPSRPAGPRAGRRDVNDAVVQELSTEGEPLCTQAVDDLLAQRPENRVTGASTRWLGTVVPKRHAKRSVTRTLLKRQIRAAMVRRVDGTVPPLPPGLWIVRLRAPFDRATYPSAASRALQAAAGTELDAMLGHAWRKVEATLVRG